MKSKLSGFTKREFLVAFCGVVAGGITICASNGARAQNFDEPFVLGNTTVHIKIRANGPGLTCFAPHDDEDTCVAAGLSVVNQLGGRLVQLSHSGRRNISFALDGVPYTFDPNRMFTERGLKASLQSQGSKNYSLEAHLLVQRFADTVLANLAGGFTKRVLVALHNNSPDRYSIQSYQEGGSEYKSATDEVSINPEKDPDDFYLVTEKRIYDGLKAKGYNVVLQRRGATDDGSLSVFCDRRGLIYVNVEAQEGRKRERVQREMLLALARM